MAVLALMQLHTCLRHTLTPDLLKRVGYCVGLKRGYRVIDVEAFLQYVENGLLVLRSLFSCRLEMVLDDSVH